MAFRSTVRLRPDPRARRKSGSGCCSEFAETPVWLSTARIISMAFESLFHFAQIPARVVNLAQVVVIDRKLRLVVSRSLFRWLFESTVRRPGRGREYDKQPSGGWRSVTAPQGCRSSQHVEA
jgi:hypothetical protein